MHATRTPHLKATHRILRCLKSSPERDLMSSNHGHIRVEVSIDANWASSGTYRRSTLGYCSLVGGNLVTWRSKKQSLVARSSVEEEYRSMAHGVCEVLWLRTLLQKIGFVIKVPLS